MPTLPGSHFYHKLLPYTQYSPHSKLISDIPDLDVAISMGCNVTCPYIGKDFDDNWQLDDPTGKSDEEFIINIEEKVQEL